MDIPRHIALIPDGNRRWAEERGLKPWEGHAAGIKRFREFLDWCYDIGVREVTAYSLSKENFEKRANLEIEYLFKLYEANLLQILASPETKEKGVKVEFVGNLGSLPAKIKKLISELESSTRHFKKKRLTLCINYSGREEILHGLRELVKKKKPITEKNLGGELWVKSAPDLLIRTAENRISNFLLWQCAYSEIYFSPKLFPDFSRKDLMDALRHFKETQRRYGK